MGSLAAAAARISLRRGSGSADRFNVLVEAGYKSDGFVRGERLHRGAILRAGVSLSSGRF